MCISEIFEDSNPKIRGAVNWNAMITSRMHVQNGISNFMMLHKFFSIRGRAKAHYSSHP